ncbi:glycosyltransferase, partial [Cronobacter sakazakii]|uniref:glycosyltransferase family 2 protein n=1 Tax=Cronobacter sakazakii TaxID=28141 RepID=UPI000CFB2644
NKPLVTIVVASFNAEKYILETLESCINQTYQNIEIIIVDDCSNDNSVQIIEQWCDEKKISHPSIPCSLVKSERNSGIPANLNNSLHLIKGKWIKCIGSDDILLPEAISEFIKRLNLYAHWDNIGAVFTYFETFGANVKKSSRYPLSWTRDICKMRASWLKRQLAMLHFNNVAPCAFINRSHFDGFDTSYRLLEDLPLWLKLIEKNAVTLFFDYTTVLYRLHDSQITSLANPKVNNVLINDLKHLNEFRLMRKHYLAYLHHKFNLHCSLKRTAFYRYLKTINPFNLVIRLYESLKQ